MGNWIAGTGGPWRAVEVNLDEPIDDVPTSGAAFLRVTAFLNERPLGSMSIGAALDPMPGSVLTEILSREFATAVHRERLRVAMLRSRGRPAGESPSVVVCTRDRPDELARCLESLRASSPEIGELIVVDNGSDPAVRRIVENARAAYVREPLPGLDRARNRALAMVAGDVVLFTDDDVEVDRRWARWLTDCYEDPLVMAATGLVLPARLDTETQRRAEKYAGHGRGFASKIVDGGSVAPVTAGALGAGSSMSFRTDFLRAIGGFPEELDAGMPTATGGDTYALYRVLRAGYRIVYEPRAIAYHWHRNSEPELRRMVRGNGTGLFAYLIHASVADSDREARVGLAGAAKYLGSKLGRSMVAPKRSTPLSLSLEEMRGAMHSRTAYASARRLSGLRPPVEVTSSDMPAPWLGIQGLPEPAAKDEALPSLSVVIPTRGRGEVVIRLLRELELQDYPEELIETLVCVDGDIDGTIGAIQAAQLRKSPTLFVLDAPDDYPEGSRGAAAARNEGAEKAANDVLVFLDDDVVPAHRRLLIAHAREHRAGADAVTGPCWVDLRSATSFLAQILRNWWVDHNRGLVESGQTAFTHISSGNFSIGRELFSEMGGFDQLPRREDWQLGYRLLTDERTVATVAAASVLQDIEVDIHNFLRDRRLEGTGDCMWASKNPAVFAHLPLARWYEMTKRRVVVTSLLAKPDRANHLLEIAPRLLERLETRGLRRRFTELVAFLSFLAYWAGVGDAARGLPNWNQLAAEGNTFSPQDQVVPIGQPVPWTSPPVDAGDQLQVHHRDRPLGLAPVRWGGLPWNADRFASAIIDHYADAALTVEVLDDLGT